MKTYTITMNENQVKAIASVQATLQSVDAEYYDAFMSIDLPALESEEQKHTEFELFDLIDRKGGDINIYEYSSLPKVTGMVEGKKVTQFVISLGADYIPRNNVTLQFLNGDIIYLEDVSEEDRQKLIDFAFLHFDDARETFRHGSGSYSENDYILEFDTGDKHFCCCILEKDISVEGNSKIYEFESGNDWIKVVIHGQNDFDVYVNSELETSKRPQKVDGSEVDAFKEITTNGHLDVEKIIKKLDHPYIPDGNDPNDPCSLDSYLPLFSIVVHNMFETFEDFYTFTMDAIPDMFNVFKEIYKDSTFNSRDAECFFENFIITILPWIKEQGWSNMQGFNCNYISR